MTDDQIIKAKAVIDELSKILGNTEKESQVTNITSLAAYQTLLDIEKNNNEKLKAENERLMARNDELNALNKSASIEAVKATIVEIGNRLCHYGKCDQVYMYEVLDVMVEVEEELTNTKSKEADENKRAKIAMQSFQEAGYRLSRDLAKSAEERYKNIIEALNSNATYPPLIAITLDMVINSAKSEAIKEFAERYERAIEQLLTSATIEQAYVIYKCLDKFKALSYRECTKGCHEIPKESEEMVGDDYA